MNNAYKDFSYYYDDLMEVIEYDLWYEFILPYLKPNDHILDLACGTGTLAVILANAGYETYGLDLSEKSVFLAKEKAMINRVYVDLKVADMTDFSYDREFDMITCFFDSINFITKEQIPNLLNCADKCLKKDGYFIFDLFTKNKLAEVDGDDFSDELAFANYRWQSKVFDDVIYHEITIDDGLNPFTEIYQEFYHDYHLLLDPCFELIDIVTDFIDNFDEENGERILIVLKKK